MSTPVINLESTAGQLQDFRGSIVFNDRAFSSAAFPGGFSLRASDGVAEIAKEAFFNTFFSKAVAMAPCSFDNGGNGGQPGTLIMIVTSNSGKGRNHLTDFSFFVYPTDLTGLLGNANDIETYALSNANSAIYLNAGGVTAGNGHIKVNGGVLNPDL